jgi:methylmalonyl-CoA mutase N-terminal domain/subunit
VVVGVNRFVEGSETGESPPDAPSIPLFALDPDAERRQSERVRAVRATRSRDASQAALEAVSAAALDGSNLVPPILAAVEAFATLGEIADAMRRVFGEHAEQPWV